MARQPRRSPVVRQTEYARAPYAVAKVTNFAGGLNTAAPETIDDNDLTEATNVQYTHEGRVKARKGCTRRFAVPVSSRPVLNAGALYRQDGTSRLVVATDTELFAQTPQRVFDYNTHEQFTQAGASMDVVAHSSSVQLLEVLDDGFEAGNFVRWASATPGWVIDNTIAQAGTRSARGDGFDQRLRYTFFGDQPVIRIRVHVRAGQLDRLCLPVVLVHPDGSVSQPVVLNSNGRVMFHNGLAYADFPIVRSYTANTWIALDFRLENGLFWLTADGTALNTTGISLRNTNNVAQTLVRSWDVINNITAATGTLWIDTVVVTLTGPPTFARASTAFRQNGTSVASGVPRYEHHRFPHHRWQDLFDTDQIATHYTSGGDVAGTTGVSGGVLTYSGGTHATLLRTGLTLTDGEITVNTDQAHDAGIVFRHVDNNNYYLLSLRDDSGHEPARNVVLFRRVAGAWTDLGGVDRAWPRGTVQQFRVTFHGSLIEVWHGSVRVLSVTDTTFTTGGVGLRNSSATAFRVLDWTVHQAQQGLMVEEGTTNLLSANQSSVETDLTGFAAHQTGVTLVRDTTQFWHGAASIRADCNGSVFHQGWITSLIPYSAGQPIAASIWVRGSGNLALLQRDVNSVGNRIGEQWVLFTATGAWQRITNSRVTAAGTTHVELLLITQGTAQAVTFWVDGLQLEQRAYATSWQLGGTPRVAETLTVPTANVFNRGNWTVEGIYSPQVVSAHTTPLLFALSVNPNNTYLLSIGPQQQWQFIVWSSGIGNMIASPHNAVTLNTPYYWQISGDGTTMRLCVNGILIGETTYTEPVGTLPANMHIGSNNAGGQQANGVISNLRISSRARTLAEHQTVWNNGQPLTADANATYLLPKNGSLEVQLSPDRSGHWTSPVQDSGSVLNNVPLHIAWDDVAQVNNTLTVQTRTSVDNVVWSAWQDRINPSTLTVASMRFSQVRALFSLTGNARPSQLRQVTVSHAALQAPVLLAGGLPQAQDVSFGQLSNIMVICNGVDFPRSYDGAALTLLTTAPRAQLVTTYQNRLFLGKTPTQRSALFFSGLLAPHDYSSTGEAGAGQINVNPEDGDELMCLLPAAFALLVAKQHHTYFLQGYSPATFRISPPNIGGTVSHKGLVWTPQGFFRIDREGVWFTDFRQQNLISKKIQHVWDSLEHTRLHQAAMYFYNDRVLVAVTERGQTANNILMVYDLGHRAWSVWHGWSASCFLPFRDFQHWHHFFGSSITGNLFEMGIGNTDDGAPITSAVTTKPYTFGQDQRLKRFKWADLVFSNAEQLTPATAEARADEVSAGAVNFTLPQDIASTVYRLNTTPFGRGISVRTTFTGPATLQSLVFTYFGKTDRPERIG